MAEEFTRESRVQRELEWLAILDFFLAGGGAGLFLLGLLLDVGLAAAIGVVATALGALALLADLGHPERFWRALLRPGTSWISRGAILVIIFLVFGALYAAPTISWFEWLPWTADTGFGTVAGVIAGIAGVGVMAYTGFLLADSPAIPSWHSSVVPTLFIAFSLITATGSLYLILPALDEGAVELRVWEGLGLGVAPGALLLVVAYLLALLASTVGARQTLRELTLGRLALPFVGGGILAGLVAPLGIVVYLFLTDSSLASATPPLGVAGALLVIGSFLLRHSLVKAGTYQPMA